MQAIFFDWETQSEADLTVVGALGYALDVTTRPLLLSWVVDDGPVRLWCPYLEKELDPEVWTYVHGRMATVQTPPLDLIDLLHKDDTYLVAWNTGFDRAIWQQIATPDLGFPPIVIEQTLDAMAQASSSNLPGKLDFAGRMLGLGQKTVGGNAVMKRFADRRLPLPGSPEDLGDDPRGRPARVQAAIVMWALYLDYSEQDTLLLRDVWRCTRPLDRIEWAEYHTSERINDRGKLVDLDVARGAVQYREEEAAHVAERIAEITDGVVTSPTLTQQINKWLYSRLPEALGEMMVKERDPDTGEVKRLTGAKGTMTQLIEEIGISDYAVPDDVLEFLDLLQYGRSSSAIKFQKMIDQNVDGRIYNAYVFNGAGQTHRFSSKSLQEHNLVRDVMPNELDVLDMIAARVPIEQLRHLPISKKPEDIERAARGATAVSTVLSRSIRPTFIAPEGRKFVWCDWSQIEARVTPWLANTRAAFDAVLAPFINDEDLYILNAADIYHLDPVDLLEKYESGDQIAYNMRQAGKVAGLALSFGGGLGALKAMARNYSLKLSDEEGQRVVDGWRDRNRWARKFGDQCETAAFHAMNAPLEIFPAGRLKYQFLPDLIGGTMACFLPDMKPILYPMARVEKIERFEKMTDTITYLNGMGRRSYYRTIAVENGTQALAASILRGTLVRLEEEEPGTIVGHTHDEVLGEVDDAMAGAFSERLHAVMVRGFSWTEGLPLAAKPTTNWFYTKS